MRRSLIVAILLFLTGTALLPRSKTSTIQYPPSSSFELVEEINALRAANGLAPYTSNSILMNIAQNQADYMASIGTWTHTGPDGSRPYQRALAAGYPVAGDLSLGGWFSENVTYGIDKSASTAVMEWQGDDLHLNTMLSPTLVDIGAGVAVVGNTYYYVIDCGLSTGGTAVAYTPPAYLPTGTLIPNTPGQDGSVIHVVGPNDTIFGIALAYGVPPDQIYTLNNITGDSTIYIGQNIYIRALFTPTPTLPTPTMTSLPSATFWPSSTAILSSTPLPVTSQASPGVSTSRAGWSVVVITIIALGLAAILSSLGGKR